MDFPGTPTHGMEHYGEHREVFATPLSAAKTTSDVVTPGDDSEGESKAPQQSDDDLFFPATIATPPTVDELMPPADSESIPATQASVDELIEPADTPCEETEGPLATPKPKRKAAKAKGKAKAAKAKGKAKAAPKKTVSKSGSSDVGSKAKAKAAPAGKAKAKAKAAAEPKRKRMPQKPKVKDEVERKLHSAL